VTLGKEEIRRYARQLILPEIGPEGQERLKRSSTLLIGAGGLGSPVAIYLAATGVGKIGVADFDRVEESNLPRQILYSTPDVGRPKLEVFREKLAALNPHVTITPHEGAVSEKNAEEIISEYDVVVDCTDNYPTRYLLHDTAARLRKPSVYGAVFRFEGEVSVFDRTRGPCYRCLYPSAPPPEVIPDCAERGLFGIVPGVIGTIQATEAVKLLIGKGEPLLGRLLTYDALRMEFREMNLPMTCPHN
jgi:molybdopterin/thiamine biosynthesis adenylyltransferase